MARCGGGGAPKGPGPAAAERRWLKEALAEQLRQDLDRWARGGGRAGAAPGGRGHAVTVPSRRLLAEGTHSDVTFQVGDEEVRVHRAVLLARAPLLCERLAGGQLQLEPAELREFLR